jgi:hypothetical protein
VTEYVVANAEPALAPMRPTAATAPISTRSGDGRRELLFALTYRLTLGVFDCMAQLLLPQSDDWIARVACCSPATRAKIAPNRERPGARPGIA